MKHLESISPAPTKIGIGLEALGRLLSGRRPLRERRDVMPFLQGHPEVACFIGSLNLSVGHADRIAFEYDLWGSFSCDLVIGATECHRYLLVEFEDDQGVFRKSGRATHDWSTRFEYGYSQIIDWLWKLDEMRDTMDFRDRFGSRDAEFVGLLVVGRDHDLSVTDRRRLRWRSSKVSVNSSRIACMTFDQLHIELTGHLSNLRALADAKNE